MSTRQNNELILPRTVTHKLAANVAELSDVAKEKINWAESLLGIPSIWTKTMGEGTTVAILDTGIDESHPDLADAIVGVKDFTGDGITDVNGHGTHCAGVVVARANGVGFIGVAPKASILIGKVISNKGKGKDKWLSKGIEWAISKGADIISMSLGGSKSSKRMFSSVHNALSRGILIICAAGNAGARFTNSIGYPGRYGSVITIGSHDKNGNLSGFSSRGGEIDFTAPGSNIWSTYKNGGYAELSGTSMATPFVAGLSALIVSKHKNSSNKTPLNNNEDLREHLLRMANHPGYHDNESGYGPLMPFQYFHS